LGKRKRVVYASVKAVLEAMTRTAAIETGADGVTVNSVKPAPVVTMLFNRGHSGRSVKWEAMIDKVPGKRQCVVHTVMILLAREGSLMMDRFHYVCGCTSIIGTGGE
jgi:NAD(P)-dependent dehydrogenase (short-subunit alcohol dehydrogenase family)